MAVSFESKANINFLKESYKKFVSAGEKQTADGFKMSIDGFQDITFLVQASNIAPMQREPVETYGPHGVQFSQQGRPKNMQEVQITFVETIKGNVLKMLRDLVVNKKYTTFTFEMQSETNPSGQDWTKVKYEDSWIESDAIEFSVEDNTAVKPQATIHVNWPDFFK